MTKVKICGLTNKDDATWAINFGADYLGLNFYSESPRHCSLSTTIKWVKTLPPFIPLVGVFVNAPQKDIIESVIELSLKGVQLHGDETPETIDQLKLQLQGMGRVVFFMKAFRMKDESTIEEMKKFKDSADYFLLDAYVENELGGTGKVFNWDLAIKAKELGKPIFLAGGLTPENVKDAIKKVKPFGVDVSSGVEKSVRKKDRVKMKDFIEKAKG